MVTLRDKLAATLPALRDEIKNFVKAHGEREVATVNIGQLYGGMRGVRAMVCDTSLVPADKGLLVRGLPISQLVNRLPEEVFYLLATGELPARDAMADIREQFHIRGVVPRYVWDVLDAMPPGSHPMAMLSAAILSLQRESVFAARYAEMSKEDYWLATYEDVMNLLAKLPAVAAYIYRLRFDKGPRILGRPDLDWAANYAHMLGLPSEHGSFPSLMRLYLVLHCDHEGGNVSAFTTHTVGSALSDAYYSLAAGLCGLAGPLHGLANQECVRWVLETINRFGGAPSKEQIKQYTEETLKAKKVIPGYGHAVLRVVDPRFTALLEFGRQHCKNDPVFETVQTVFEGVPEVLRQVEKISDPWPNVDAVSGSLLYHFGLKEFSYYTVLFAVSRAMGVLANLIINRGIGAPILRPKSMTTDECKALVAKPAEAKG